MNTFSWIRFSEAVPRRYTAGLANLFSVECHYHLDLLSHKIFGVPRQKIKSVTRLYASLLYYFSVYIGVVSLFLMWGQQSKVPTRCINGAMQSEIRAPRVSSYINGVWGGVPVAWFWKIFSRMELFSVYHVRGTVHKFEQVDDVVPNSILILIVNFL